MLYASFAKLQNVPVITGCNSGGEAERFTHDCIYKTEVGIGPISSLICSQAKRPVEECENGRDKTEPPAVEPQQQQHGNKRPPALLFIELHFFSLVSVQPVSATP